MPKETFEFHISVKRLLIALAVTIIPITVAGLYSLAESEKSLEQTIGTHFKTIAEGTAAEIAQFVHDRVIDVGVMAGNPTLVDAVTAANRSYHGMTDAAIHARIEKIEKEWSQPTVAPFVGAMLASDASRMLRRHQATDRRFLRITVTDEYGATIAATHKTIDYFQADEEFWQHIYAHGRGSVSLTDLLYDEVTKSHYIGVGAPILDETTGSFIGAVDALVDISTLFPFVDRVRIGPTGRASLVRDDGAIIVAPGVTLSMNLKSDVLEAVQESLQTLEGRQAGYLVSAVRRGARRLIGFADTGLKEDYGNLSWIVLVSQDASQAFAPTRLVGRLIAFMAVISLAMVTFLSVWFSLHRKPEYTDLEEEIAQLPAVSQKGG